MEGKIFLRQVQNQLIADFLIDELEAAGFGAYSSQGSYPYPHPAAPVEIWLKDKSDLEKPGAKEAIDEILNPPSFDLEPEDEIPPTPRSRFRWWHFVGVFLVLFAAWLGLFGKEPAPYQFMKGGVRVNLSQDDVAYFERFTSNGIVLMFEESKVSVEKRARFELLKNGFEEKMYSEGPTYDKIEIVGEYKRLDEFIGVVPGTKQDPITKAVSDEPKVCYVYWGYRPSLAQAIRRLMGF